VKPSSASPRHTTAVEERPTRLARSAPHGRDDRPRGRGRRRVPKQVTSDSQRCSAPETEPRPKRGRGVSRRESSVPIAPLGLREPLGSRRKILEHAVAGRVLHRACDRGAAGLAHAEHDDRRLAARIGSA
jgi:hypothetical protein